MFRQGAGAEGGFSLNIPDYGAALRELPGSPPTGVGDALSATAEAAGFVDIVLYLVDFEQRVLLPLPSAGAHVDYPVSEPVEGTMAGRAFRDQQVLTVARDGGAVSGYRSWRAPMPPAYWR